MQRRQPNGSNLHVREVEISTRLREVRHFLRISQEEFARQVGVPRDRLASYEACRAPLKCWFALKVCRQFVVSERWLATGTGYDDRAFRFGESAATRKCLSLEREPRIQEIPDNSLFSEAYDQHIAPVEGELAVKYLLFGRFVYDDDDNIDLLKNWLAHYCDMFLARLPKRGLVAYVSDLINAGYLLQHEHEIGSLSDEEKAAGFPRFRDDMAVRMQLRFSDYAANKNLIASELSNAKLMAMKVRKGTLWGSLKSRLAEVVEQEGKRTELAASLGVTASAVSQWLSGATKPTAEATLQLLEWVRVEEAKPQTKKPSGAVTPEGSKTRRKESKKNERPKSGPRQT